ncbi:MAG: hypothetical protein J6K96_03845 [Treponema sp.]|nr:hypothetical protein [Treponema sp.]
MKLLSASFVLAAAVFMLGCSFSSERPELSDLKVRYHFLQTFNGTGWNDVSGADLLRYGAGQDKRFSAEDGGSFLFTLSKDTSPSVITNWFFDTSLGTALRGVEASVTFIAGSPGFCGIYFPATPASERRNYESCFFGVNSTGEYAVFRSDKDGSISKIAGDEDAAVREGFGAENVLKAYFEADNLILQINGKTVRTITDAGRTSGRTGLFVRVLEDSGE